jgi:hypothetical protein
MDNKQSLQNLKDINLLFETIGFDDKTKKDHLSRIMTIIFAAVAEKLDQATALKEKAEFPEMKSLKDFYDYYGQYTDQATIDKIINEETFKSFSEYFKAIAEKLPQ